MKKTSSVSINFWTIIPFLAVLFSTSVYAHAHLHSATPKSESVVTVMPSEIKLDFSEKIEPSLSSFQVLDSSGRDLFDKISLDMKDPKEAHLFLRSGAKPGKYKVQWKVVSVDSHKSSGQFTFSFQPE